MRLADRSRSGRLMPPGHMPPPRRGGGSQWGARGWGMDSEDELADAGEPHLPWGAQVGVRGRSVARAVARAGGGP